LERLAEGGIRQAGPGEFTLRAFLAGRIDLTRAEAVLGVIDAQSEQEMTIALRQLAGGLIGPLERVRERLLDVLARMEAGLDFADEDIEFISRDEILRTLDEVQGEFKQVRDQLRSRAVRESHVRVVLRGRPNAGKSSLFNAMLRLGGRPGQALVSGIAGTTRDYLTGTLSAGGTLFQLFDTAGTEAGLALAADHSSHMEPATEPARRAEAVASEVAARSQITILCLDSTRPLDAWERDQASRAPAQGNVIVVATKSDLVPRHELGEDTSDENVLRVSSVTGEGLTELAARLVELTGNRSVELAGLTQATIDRCADGLIRAAAELDQALEIVQSGGGEELASASLRTILDELAIVTGRVCTDDILDRIFSRFCIGK
jgi:tRNA modification GTPase